MAERVWDRFLTEQDKATLVGKPDRRVGFGERPAIPPATEKEAQMKNTCYPIG